MPHIVLEFRHFVPSCAEQTSPNEHFRLAKPPFEATVCRNLNLQYTLWVWGHSLRESEPAVHTLWGHSLRELWGNFLREPEPAEHTLWGHSWRELFEAILWGNPNLQYTLFSSLRKSEPAVGRERVTQYWLFSTPTGHYTFWSKMLMELQMCSSLNINAVPTKACWMPRTLPIFTDLKEL